MNRVRSRPRGGRAPKRGTKPYRTLRPEIETIIGIDPGRSCGIWIADRNRKLVTKKTTQFWDCIDLIGTYDPASTVLVIEDPSENKPTWSRGTSEAARRRIADNVGRNKQDAILLIERFRRDGYEVVTYRPSSQKWDQAQYQRMSGDDSRTSQHIRDAARAVLGTFWIEE